MGQYCSSGLLPDGRGCGESLDVPVPSVRGGDMQSESARRRDGVVRAEAGTRGVEAARPEERGEAGIELELAGQRGSGISVYDGIARRTLALAHASPGAR